VAGAHRFHREIPGSRLVVIAGAGHFVVEDAPERVAQEITGFLS
jgi:pimeloyl-ACP methyl ester carboxylesterase